MTSPTALVGYLILFNAIGIGFVLFNLLLGRIFRPNNPSTEKQEIYECGEPTIGSSYVQFDLRFYVIALLFIIFDVEVAFFFPWATVFGKATHLQDPNLQVIASQSAETLGAPPQLSPSAIGLHRELGFRGDLLASTDPTATASEATASVSKAAGQLVWLSVADIVVFFAVLLVGFAYVWKRGDLDWVRADSHRKAIKVSVAGEAGRTSQEQPVLSA